MSSQPGGGVAVSVVVPVYNPGRFIEGCIESLLGQSLPSDRYEVIFVDDGSTDETPQRLDQVAAQTPNVHVIHEPGSGWSGRPRNVGIDHAVGRYVFFCDHDDWMGPQALERMASFADEAGADILIGKSIGHRRRNPQALFLVNNPDATLATTPLMSSLKPHKLFRRSFLNDHELRFPEGKRRLEDHVFVVRAYLLASKIAVLSDYTCYHHMRRDDGSNAASQRVSPAEYFRYVREVIDVVLANTEPGPERDLVLDRPFNGEMLGRLAKRRVFDAAPAEYRDELFHEIRSLMLERFPADFSDHLALTSRIRAAAVRDDRMDTVLELNDRLRALRGRIVLRSFRWDTDHWHAEIEAEAVFADGSPVRVSPVGDDRWSVDPQLLPADVHDKFDIGTTELLGGRTWVTVVQRSTDEEWFVPSSLTAELRHIPGDAGPSKRVVVAGSADFDPTTIAGGALLPNGIWDITVRFASLGVDLRARIGVDEATQRPIAGPAVVGKRRVAVIPFLTQSEAKLTLDVGQRKHTFLEALLARPVGPASVGRDTLTARVDVDIAPAASKRVLRLQLRADRIVVGRLKGVIIGGADGTVLRIGTVPSRSGDGAGAVYGPGRYTLAAKSPTKGAPYLLGTVDVDRRGRIVAANFDPEMRHAVVALPRRYGKRSTTRRIGGRIRRTVRGRAAGSVR